MTDLWIATGNQKKRRELERLLGPLGVRLRGPEQAGQPLQVDEDQPDFAGNARKKAAALARLVAGVALADDSGLCVDALDGRPGVHSARYGGPGLTDRQRLERLLRELADVPAGRRTARFVCSICLCGPDGDVRCTVEEACEGILLPGARGGDGFGYDPIFVALDHLRSDPAPSFAQLDAGQKDRISHRGKALRRLRQLIENDPSLLSP